MTKPHNDHIWNEIETMSIQSVLEQASARRLPDQLACVLTRSGFYRDKLRDFTEAIKSREKGVFESLPFTEKSELLQDQANHPPFGRNACVGMESIRRIQKTSGATGRPLMLAATEEDIRLTHEAGARCFWAAGLRPRHMVVHCLNFCMWAGGLTDDLSLETVGSAVIPFGVGNSKLLIETIQLLRPNAIHCTPSYLSKLELILHDDYHLSPRDLGLELGLFGGEGGLENPDFRRQIEDVWGLRAVNANYGMSDVLSMFGSECAARDGLHFMGQGIIHPEIIAPETLKPIPVEAGAVGELVLTNLWKQAQPVVRLRTRDMIEVLATDRCDCGRRGFRFRVAGRSDDMIVVRGINVFPGAAAGVVNRHLDRLTGEYRVIVDREPPVRQMILEIELKPDQEPDANWLNRLGREFSDRLGITPEIRTAGFGGLPRTDGKIKRVQRIL